MCDRKPFFCVALVSLIFLVFAPALNGDVQEPGAPPKPEPIPSGQVDEQLVAEAPPGSDVIDLRVTSRQQRHLAWVTKLSGRRTVWLDGKPVGTYDEVKYLGFRGNDPQLTFAASRGSKWIVFANGSEHGGDYTKITEPDIGAAGNWAAGACRGKTCRLLSNGTETGPAFEEISWADFSPNGEHNIYFGKQKDKWIALVDGRQAGPEMDGWWTRQWLPDGKRVAIAALQNDKCAWMIDGQPGPSFDVISSLVFSPDHEHYAFAGATVEGGFKSKEVTGSIVVDGKPVETGFKGRGIAGHWTWMVGQGQYIKKGVRQFSADFHGVSDPSYTPNGDIVFGHRIGDNRLAVRIGKQDGPVFDDLVSPIVIDAEGHVAYVAKKAGAFVEVRDHEPGVTAPANRGHVGAPLLGPDRDATFVSWIHLMPDHLAYVTVRGGAEFRAGRSDRALRRLMLDGVPGPEYDAFGLMCQVHDTGHYACVVNGAEKDRDRIVVDARESRLYDEIVPASVDLRSDGGVEFVARQERRILRVVVRTSAITTSSQ